LIHSHGGKLDIRSKQLHELNTVNAAVPSIFDLSAPEKLQLVEDLWDDLAATPDAVPIRQRQREEPWSTRAGSSRTIRVRFHETTGECSPSTTLK
jgi:hypothetical protein